MDFRPLRRHRDYRWLFAAQFVSFLGTMVTYVALPYQMFKLTGSSLAVGLLGLVSRSGAGPFLELGERCTYGYSSGQPENFGPATMCLPMGVAAGPGDELFVSDAGVNRVVVFELP